MTHREVEDGDATPARKTKILLSLGSHGEDAMKALPLEDVRLKTLKLRSQVDRARPDLLGVESIVPSGDYAEQEWFFNAMSRDFLRQYQEPGSMSDIVKGLSEDLGLQVVYSERYNPQENAAIVNAMQEYGTAFLTSRQLFSGGRYDEAVAARLHAVDVYAGIENFRTQRIVDLASTLHGSDFKAGEDLNAVYRFGSIHSKAYNELKRITRDAELTPDQLKEKYPHLTVEQAEAAHKALARFKGIEVEREFDRTPYVFPTTIELVRSRMYGRIPSEDELQRKVAQSFIEDFVADHYGPQVDVEKVSRIMRDTSKGAEVEDARQLSVRLAFGDRRWVFQDFLDARGIELPAIEEVRASDVQLRARRRK